MVLLEALVLKLTTRIKCLSKEILFVTCHQFLISFFPSCVSQSRTTGFEILGKYLSLLPIPWQYFITIWELLIKCQCNAGFSFWRELYFLYLWSLLLLFINRTYLSHTDFRISGRWSRMKRDVLNPQILKYLIGAGELLCICHLENSKQKITLNQIVYF